MEVSQPFVDLIGDVDENDKKLEQKVDSAASTINPNYREDRKLFQRQRADFFWDSDLPYDKQPNMLQKYGPVEVQWHFQNYWITNL